MRLGICYTLISAENKQLVDAAAKRGVVLERLVDGESVLEVTSKAGTGFDAILQRSVSFSRSTYLTYFWERNGVDVVNGSEASRVCGDKMFCSLELARAGVPTPRTYVAFSPEAAKLAASKLGFPLVMKPVMGSWARMVSRINSPEALSMAIDLREEMGNPWQKVYYLQEHINKPGRDIRAFVVGEKVVAAIYRNSTEKSGWVTNAGKGAQCTPCPLSGELVETSLAAAGAVGEGIYGVDLMESENGLVVHEINHTAEFKSCAASTGEDIAGAIVEYAVSKAKR